MLKAITWRLELRQSLSELSVSLFIIVCNMLWWIVKNFYNGALILVAWKWCERGNRLEGWKLLPQWSHRAAKQRSHQPTWAISWCASEGVWVLQSCDWGEHSETTNGLLQPTNWPTHWPSSQRQSYWAISWCASESLAEFKLVKWILWKYWSLVSAKANTLDEWFKWGLFGQRTATCDVWVDG